MNLITTLYTFSSLRGPLEKSVEIQVAQDDDGVGDVKDELVDGHDLQEEDGVVTLRTTEAW